jgi:hypothetical protein
MDEYTSLAVIAFVIGVMSYGGALVAMILDHVVNSTVGYLSWGAIIVIGLAVLFSVEYAGSFCKCHMKR